MIRTRQHWHATGNVQHGPLATWWVNGQKTHDRSFIQIAMSGWQRKRIDA
jgi:hypothetical protein